MSPQSRRDAVARASFPSLAGIAARVAAPSRGRARARRWAARALLAIPAAAVLVFDVLRRGRWLGHLPEQDASTYVVSLLMSGLLWGSLVCAASRGRGSGRWVARGALVLGALLAVGAQLYTFDRYQAYLNHRAVLVGTSMMPSVGQQLWTDRASFARFVVPAAVLAGLLPWLVRKVARPRMRAATWSRDLAVLAVLLMAFSAPGRSENAAATPDVLYLAAMGQLGRAHWDHNEAVERLHPGPRSPQPVPALEASPKRARNVLLVLTESVRASSTCVAYTHDCAWTPFSNEAAPDRLPLLRMRAVDSTTAISLAVMWSGHAPTEPRAALHSAPLLWEYAQAANLATAYWTSQNLLFGNSGEWVRGLPLTKHVSATELDPGADLDTGADDGALVDKTIADLPGLREPFVGVMHLANTHYPYAIDDRDAPFQPQDDATGPGYEREIRNRYQDAIWKQDRAVGRFLRALRATPAGSRTVVVFLSDHGEQMREKGAVGHTGTLYEEEIRIPAWIDAPPGTLDPEEERSLRALESAPLTTLDVLPTLLDLAGIWDAPALAPFRAQMPGASLLRGGSSADRALVMTNCTELWQCAFKNWGAIRGDLKLIAHQYDASWSCFDTANDPLERNDLGEAACGDLRTLAEADGRGRPF
jgi:glucan phosphoethanolaminetransferase (alkaline phosphatase superfamily)